MIRTIHPFPARMAPDLTLSSLKDIKEGSPILDPMVGSGMVIRQAASLGYRCIGFDIDPLAVLISKVWNTPVDEIYARHVINEILNEVRSISDNKIFLPWVDEDKETSDFVNFWFGAKQIKVIRRIAFVLYKLERVGISVDVQNIVNIVKVALSRIIITKERQASLARDTSHSRPHKVAEHTDFEVLPAFIKSIDQVLSRIADIPKKNEATIEVGDARSLSTVADSSVDAVITSPPYLNAIDYMRGHRMSLVWFGKRINELRNIRVNNIGAERAINKTDTKLHLIISSAMGDIDLLPNRDVAIVYRYAIDLYKMFSEVKRVIRPFGKSTFVMGNSCLKGVFIKNSDGLIKVASILGMKLINSYERELPLKNRYLPFTKTGALSKRMKMETILTFEKP